MKTGERVRIWLLAAGPSKGMSFHVVGSQFDTVYKEGGYLLRTAEIHTGKAEVTRRPSIWTRRRVVLLRCSSANPARTRS